MEHLELYEKYRTVPKEALKDFDNGKFKGTDINTMWRIKSLTEAFGICGVGWYFTIKRTWTETTPNGEQFAFAEIELFIKVDGEWSKPISGNGGNKLARVTKNGEYSTSDEAYKMAVTDALGVACRNLGFGADIYWANDKTKYAEQETPTTGKTGGTVKTASPNQIKILEKNYTGANLEKLLQANGISKLEEIPMSKASELISKIYAKKGE